MNKYICIHGHFYQPPRENPWLERVELQDSARPFHDWNERITEECYAPNARSRLLDPSGRVRDIVSNYASMSFNVGPTLLTWMEKHAPQSYEDIIAAHKESQEKFGGHSSAMAQGYNHLILPLATRRDKKTQVLWGIRDFQYRFGSFPEGMWLPETAVDLESLDVLAECGIRFTVLSQYQAKRWRSFKGGDWQECTGGRIDPTQPYLQKLPSGREIFIFFYDGSISRAAAFEGLLRDGKHLANRLLGAFVDSRKHTQLVHIATDGETYGHHHQFGEMALSYAIDHLQRHKLARMINYGQFLEMFPPTCEVDILENTSWSCMHGIERWRNNCGCNSGGHPNWNQEWRAPFLQALQWLRDKVAPLYERRMYQYLRDPWGARDAYINVILNRSRENIDTFLETHAHKPLTNSEKSECLKLLEMQRHAMLMFTSCGWFFDELSGIETVQCMQYAGRVVQLTEDIFSHDASIEPEFLRRLSYAHSNLSDYPDGSAIYQRMVKPAMIDLLKVGAHYAVASIFEPEAPDVNLYSYSIHRDEIHVAQAGKATFVTGVAHITCETTQEAAQVAFGAIHFGDHTINAGVRHFICAESLREFTTKAIDSFNRMDFTGVIRHLDQHFSNASFSVASLFRDEQRRVLDRLLMETKRELDAIYKNIYKDNYTLMRFLVEMGNDLPRPFTSITGFYTDMRLREILAEEEPDLALLQQILEDARRWKFQFDSAEFGHLFRARVENMMQSFVAKPHHLEILAQLEEFVGIVKRLPFHVNLWKVQNEYFQLTRTVYPAFCKDLNSVERDANPWCVLFHAVGAHLSISLPALP